MIETNIPEINVDELMEKIRAEVKQRKEGGGPPRRTVPQADFAPPSDIYPKIDLSRVGATPVPEPFEYKEQGYHINDFLKYHDQQFVVNAYRGILRRGPDSEGLGHYLDKLRSGKRTKAEILGRLRYSPEGKTNKVKTRGLFWNFAIQSSFRIPVLGYCSRLTTGIINLPLIIRNMENFERNTVRQLQQQSTDLNGTLSELGSYLEKKADRDALEMGLEKKADRDALEMGLEKKADRDALEMGLEKKADRDALELGLEKKTDKEQIVGIEDQIRDILRQTRDHKLNILDQQRRLMFLLEEARKRLPEPISTDQIKEMLTEEDHLLDVMYASFEDRYRGTREDIKQRQSIYLPYIRNAEVGTAKSPIIDLGCGRGEWLELLRDENLVAKGVDINRIFLEICRDLDLEVVDQDAVAYLRSLKSNSVGVITAFHLIEHLPNKTLIELLDESLRVIIPGGLVIFETPNAKNLLVGSYYFYMDPTHQKPLPPPLCEFLLEARGFIDLIGLDLHPFENFQKPIKGDDELTEIVNQHLFGPRDFAVIGKKA